jgi:hypothetical protein
LEISPNTRHSTQAPFFNPLTAPASTPAKLTAADLQVIIQTPEQRQRRKTAREFAALWDELAREAGFEPIERRTAWAITIQINEYGQAPELPRWVTLAAIGKGLSSKTEDAESVKRTARNRVGHLFNHAIPRCGYQILTRYKAAEGEDKPHAYVDHISPVAAFFSELLAEEFKAIEADKTLDRHARRAAKAEARARLVTEALTYLPRCEAALVAPDGEVYAYVSGPEAKAYCARNQGYTVRPLDYSEPEPDKTLKPFCSEDLERMSERDLDLIEKRFDQIAARNTPEVARRYAAEWIRKMQKRAQSWIKTSDAVWKEREEEEELIIVAENSETPPSETGLSEGGGAETVSAPPHDKSCLDNDLQEHIFETDSAHASAEVEPATVMDDAAASSDFGDCLANGQKTTLLMPESGVIDPRLDSLVEALAADSVQNRGELEGIAAAAAASDGATVNFDSALEAATFYARDGWAVLPICNFDPERGRCTADWHTKDPAKPCTGKKPLVQGEGKPGDGYTAATTDLRKIRDWFTRWPGAGVGIRLDGCALIDCDLKDGGPESYEYLRDTFGLADTLTAVTQSGGRHYVFRLPDDLPAGWLKSWIRVADKIALPGIDLKVGNCGLMFAEPTRGPKGIYRWIDPTVPPATLLREACDFLREIRYKGGAPAEKGKAAASTAPRTFQQDQSKFFRDVAPGDRHARLRAIGVAIRCETRASAAEMADAMRWHAARFSEPLDDEKWIERTAKSIEKKF